MTRTAILFVAHSVTAEILRRYRCIADGLPEGMEAFFALDATRTRVRHRISKRLARSCNLFLFSRDLLSRLPYNRARDDWQGRSLVPGLQDLLPQLFRRLHPGYEFIYFVEYDVLFTGAWQRFFSAFQASDAALIATSVSPKHDVPNWVHFAGFQPDRTLPEERITRSFMPISRYSQAGLDALEDSYRRGWRGHHEVLVPTAMLDAGLAIEDFGGDGPYVRDGNVNRFYTSARKTRSLTPGSFVFIPQPSEVPTDRPVLLHPCKTSLTLDLPTAFSLLRGGRYDTRGDLARCLSDPRIGAVGEAEARPLPDE